MKSNRIVVFHGTSSSFLRKIKSQGLKADPKKKVWDIDLNTSSGTSTRVSLKGAYLTANYMTASSSALNAKQKFGGNRLIISVLFQPRSGIPDEDSIRYTLNHAIERALGVGNNSFYNKMALAIFLFNLKDVNCDKKCYTDKFIEELKKQKEVNSKALNYKDAENFLQAELMRRVSQDWKNEPEYEHYKGFSDIMPHISYEEQKKISQEERDKRYEAWKKKIKKAVLSVAEADREYLKQLDIMTRRAFKGVRKSTEDFLYNVRSIEDINYRGRNRIISIVEIIEPEDYENPTILKVHYGKIPDDFIKQYKQRVGDNFKIEGK